MHTLTQAAFIVPIAILVSLCIISLIFLPLLKQPGPSLLAFGATLLGVPVYLFLVMEKPWKLRPKCLDQISGEHLIRESTMLYHNSGAFASPDWLASTTNYLLNTQ